MSSPLQNNITSLQNLLEQVNALPEASSGVELPTLTNEGSASDLLSSKELIDQEGNIVTGTFSLDTELSTQDSLISQIQTALQGKAAGGGSGSSGGSVETITIKYDATPEPGMTIHYLNESMSLQSATVNRNSSFTIAKNTIFVVENCMDSSYDGCQQICGASMLRAFLAIK